MILCQDVCQNMAWLPLLRGSKKKNKQTCKGNPQAMHTVYPYFVEWFTFVAQFQLLLNCNCFDAQDLQFNVFDKLKHLQDYANKSF